MDRLGAGKGCCLMVNVNGSGWKQKAPSSLFPSSIRDQRTGVRVVVERPLQVPVGGTRPSLHPSSPSRHVPISPSGPQFPLHPQFSGLCPWWLVFDPFQRGPAGPVGVMLLRPRWSCRLSAMPMCVHAYLDPLGPSVSRAVCRSQPGLWGSSLLPGCFLPRPALGGDWLQLSQGLREGRRALPPTREDPS